MIGPASGRPLGFSGVGLGATLDPVRSVPVVFAVVVRPPWQQLGDLGPLVPEPGLGFVEDRLLFGAPRPLADPRVQMVQPPLPALLPVALWHSGCDPGPNPALPQPVLHSCTTRQGSSLEDRSRVLSFHECQNGEIVTERQGQVLTAAAVSPAQASWAAPSASCSLNSMKSCRRYSSSCSVHPPLVT